MSVLTTCHVNDVIGVIYGDEPGERVCRVVKVRDMRQEPILPQSLARRPNITRGDHLVTCRTIEGTIRAFYSGVEKTARPIPKLKAAYLRMRGKLPRKKITK